MTGGSAGMAVSGRRGSREGSFVWIFSLVCRAAPWDYLTRGQRGAADPGGVIKPTLTLTPPSPCFLFILILLLLSSPLHKADPFPVRSLFSSSSFTLYFLVVLSFLGPRRDNPLKEERLLRRTRLRRVVTTRKRRRRRRRRSG